MSQNIQSSTDSNGNCHTTAGFTADQLQGFIRIFVRGTFFEMARTTMMRSRFLWRLIDDPPNGEDGCYHIDRDPKIFDCFMHYLVENRLRSTLPCSVVDLYHEAKFYGIELPENDCWRTVLSYTLKNINMYNIRTQMKSFAHQHGIFGWANWRQRLLVDVEFHCHRTFDLNIVHEYSDVKLLEHTFEIQSTSEKDIRKRISTMFTCSRTSIIKK